MRFAQNVALAATIASVAEGINLRRSPNPKVIGAPIKRNPVANPGVRDRQRLETIRARASKTVELDILNQETLYLINVTLGTPPQALGLHLDTGSSDLWANTPNSDFCQSPDWSDACAAYGTFDPSKSSTNKHINDLFNITYADNSGASGEYVTDKFTMGSVNLNNQQFGVGTTSSSPQGIMGIGYPADEAQDVNGNGKSYANVPQAMQQNGYINTVAYSLWLNDVDARDGNILFGGVDTEKYQGELQTLPVLAQFGIYSQLSVGMMGVGIDKGVVSSVNGLPALLDSGTSLTYLPSSIANMIIDKFDGTMNSQLGAPVVDCNLANSQHTIDYKFSDSLTISVPLSQLIEIGGGTNLDPVCILGISALDTQFVLLGDTFLRSAYVVYDLSKNEISMAPTNFGSTNSHILEITDEGVPNAEGTTGAVTAVSGGVPSGFAPGQGPATVTSVGTVTATARSTGAAVAAVTPVKAMGALAAAAGVGAAMLL